jgi:hypothetical protein
VRLEVLGQLKNPVTSGIEPSNFQLVSYQSVWTRRSAYRTDVAMNCYEVRSLVSHARSGLGKEGSPLHPLWTGRQVGHTGVSKFVDRNIERLTQGDSPAADIELISARVLHAR